MASLNNQQISTEGKSVREIGQMLREAFLSSENFTADLMLSSAEEIQLATDEIGNPRNFEESFGVSDQTMGQMLGMSTATAFSDHGEISNLSFNYRNREFHLYGQVLKT